jgi:hypothetical protein
LLEQEVALVFGTLGYHSPIVGNDGCHIIGSVSSLNGGIRRTACSRGKADPQQGRRDKELHDFGEPS